MSEIIRISSESYEKLVVLNPDSKYYMLSGKFTTDEILSMSAENIAWIFFNNEEITTEEKQYISDYVKQKVLTNSEDVERFKEVYRYSEYNRNYRFIFLHCRIMYERINDCINQMTYMDSIDDIMQRYEEHLRYRINMPLFTTKFLKKVATATGLKAFKDEEMMSVEVSAELARITEKEHGNKFISFDEKNARFIYNKKIIKHQRKYTTEVLTEDYQNIKAFIETLEQWVTENNLIEFIPYKLIACIDYIKHPEKANKLPLKYFKSEYNRLLKENPTEAKRIKATAVFPDYEEIEPNEKLKYNYYNEYMSI